MENNLVVLLLSVLVLLGAFYGNIVGQRIVKIKDEMEKLKEPIDTLRKEIIEKDNAYRKETDQMKETMKLLEEKDNAYRKETDQMKETMKLLEEKDNAYRKETDQMKETMKLLEEKDNAYRKETDQMKETMKLLEEKDNAYRKETDQMKETMKLLEEKDNAYRKETDQMKETMKLLKETATRHENTLSANKKAEKLCSQGWEEYKGHCYQFNTKQNNWDQAKIECMKQKGYLLKIEDENEFRWIVARAKAYSLNDIWIGLREINDEWRWVVDEQPARFQGWNKGEPSGDGSCVHLWSPLTYNWNDMPCSRQSSYICEHRRG